MRASLTISLLATASASLLTLAGPAAADCDPRSVQTDTHFPIRSQLRGQQGTVWVKVTVDENGRATGTSLNRSSGFRLLDRAAERSIRERWVFDVSSCERGDLPASHLVAVEYRNAEY